MPGRGHGKIGAMHNRIAADLRKILSLTVAFHPSDKNWYKVRDGTELEFALVYRKSEIAEGALRMRGGNRRVSVFPLNSNGTSRVGTFWASWHEAWRKESDGSFALLSAGWTLFEGSPGSRDKVQVLRADWDQLSHKGSKEAGHPHWHFDHEVLLSMEEEKADTPGLVEVTRGATVAEGGAASVGHIHLAMGAWNQDKNHPECWQRTYEDDCGQLRDWCVKTLQYLKGQINGG